MHCSFDTFHFANITLDIDDNTKIADGVLSAQQRDNVTGLMTPLGIADARMSGGLLKVKFEYMLYDIYLILKELPEISIEYIGKF